jgi:hypothetical protein
MAADDPNDFIYCEANWVAGDPNRIIFQEPFGSPATQMRHYLKWTLFKYDLEIEKYRFYRGVNNKK